MNKKFVIIIVLPRFINEQMPLGKTTALKHSMKPILLELGVPLFQCCANPETGKFIAEFIKIKINPPEAIYL